MNKVIFSLFVCLSLPLLLLNCSLRRENTTAGNTQRFVITDGATGKVAATYDYDTESRRLKETVVYDSQEQAKRSIEYSFDEDGELDQQIVQRPVGSGMNTDIITYHMEKEYNPQGRLVKTVQTASTGEIIETFYGYDSQGSLRGVVQRNGSGALMMMDY